MVFEAGLVSLFRTVLVLALLYYGIRLFFRYIYPSFTSSSKAKTYSNGKSSKKRNKTSDTLGEYVDFEEVEEEKKNN